MSERKKIKPQHIVLGAGIIGIGVFAAWYLTRPEKDTLSSIFPNAPQPEPALEPTPNRTKPRQTVQTGFPLKFNSRGALVKQLQQALVDKYGNVLPVHGVDGHWGKETQAALTSNGLPIVIDAPTFSQIVGSSTTANTAGTSGGGDTTLAETFLANVDATANAAVVLNSLKQIRDASHYEQISNYYKFLRRQDGLKVISLLSSILNVFSGATAHKMEAEFFRMGLKKSDGGKWSLNGFGLGLGFVEGKLITTKNTTIESDQTAINVPAKTVLGTLLKSINGTAHFITIDRQVLRVPASDVRVI